MRYILLLLLVILVTAILYWMNKTKQKKTGGADNLAAVLLEDLPEDKIEQFVSMFTPENTAGLGKRWDTAKARQLVKYSHEDAKEKAKRQNWHYALLDGQRVVGYIGIGPTTVDKYPGSQLTWMVPISARGNGYIGRGLKKIKRKSYGGRVYAFVALDNDPSNAVAHKSCRLLGRDTVFGNVHNIYLFKE